KRLQNRNRFPPHAADILNPISEDFQPIRAPADTRHPMPASLKPVFFLMLAAGGLGLLYWLAANRRSSVRPANSSLDYLIWLPPIYALFQATPLPIALVRFFSPARASLSDALAPAVAPPSWIPLSLTPSATLLDALLIGCCVIIFLIVYN